MEVGAVVRFAAQALVAGVCFGIAWAQSPAQDPVSLLSERLRKGEVRLEYHQEFGFLPDLLKLLEIPDNSQGLVFSKTSLQLHRIAPHSPRAIYFNDDVYVGYVPGGDVIEIASVDPERGSLFFGLDQDPSSPPAFVKRDDCLQCHQSQKTFDIPGLLLRSVWTLPTGYPDFAQGGGFTGGDSSPMKERWGGWYVSGTVENDVHMGNFLLRADPEKADLANSSHITKLDKLVNTNRYLVPHSDIVALIILQHQVQVHNLISRATLRSREILKQNAAVAQLFELKPGEWTDSTKRQIHRIAGELAEGLLFQGEYPLKGRVTGTSQFAEDFEKLGPRDSKGRSLRDLDLEERLLKYPCSWLIYSAAFDAIPSEVRAIVYQKMHELLDNPQGKVVAEILRETKPGFSTANAPLENVRKAALQPSKPAPAHPE